MAPFCSRRGIGSTVPALALGLPSLLGFVPDCVSKGVKTEYTLAPDHFGYFSKSSLCSALTTSRRRS